MTESLQKRRQILAQTQARAQKLEAEIKTADRKRETQKLVILGRFLLQLRERGIVEQRVFDENLNKFLVRNYDRELFGLEKIPEAEPPTTKRKPAAQPAKSESPVPKTGTHVTPAQTSVHYAEPVKPIRKLVESRVPESEFMGL